MRIQCCFAFHISIAKPKFDIPDEKNVVILISKEDTFLDLGWEVIFVIAQEGERWM